MRSIDPSTEEIVADYAAHDDAEIQRRLDTAAKAFVPWRKTSFERRAGLLRAAAALLRGSRDSLARTITLEMGKPITQSEAEIDKCALACDYFADHAAAMLAPEIAGSDASKSFIRYDPLGPVLAIMPWNFPFWQVFRFAAPHLMAGNVGVLKHAPNVPGCALAIERIFHEAGFPPGVFQCLLVENAAAQSLIAQPSIRAVTFTGSARAGGIVAAEAGKALKKTVMELGGSDAFVVLADADLQAAAAAAVASRCQNSGQSCIAAKRFIVEAAVAERFEEFLLAKMSALRTGPGMIRSSDVGPLARGDLRDNLDRQVQATWAAGAKLLLGGSVPQGPGFFYPPTILSGVEPGMAAFEEETFGPAAAVVRARDAAHAISLANQSRYGLGASLWTSDLDRASSLAGEFDSGSVFVNGMVKSDPRLPFGGVKSSGWGRELAREGIREFTNVKTVWIR